MIKDGLCFFHDKPVYKVESGGVVGYQVGEFIFVGSLQDLIVTLIAVESDFLAGGSPNKCFFSSYQQLNEEEKKAWNEVFKSLSKGIEVGPFFVKVVIDLANRSIGRDITIIFERDAEIETEGEMLSTEDIAKLLGT